MSRLQSLSILLCLMTMARAAWGAEYALHPSIAVSEEYTDNVYETRSNRITDYITRILPGIAGELKSPVLTGDLSYQYDYRYYAKQSRKDDSTHQLLARGHLVAIENLLFLDVTDDYQRVSLDVTRDVTPESLFVNQTDRNVLVATPHVVLRPDRRTTVTTGYRYTDTRYFDSVGISKTDHSGYLDLTRELTDRWSLTASYVFTRELARTDNFNQHQALGGFRYEYADKSFLFAEGGSTWIHYDDGHRLTRATWSAGASHVFDNTTVTAATGIRYDEDPLRNITEETFVKGDVAQRLVRGAVKLELFYSEFNDAQTGQLQIRKYGATTQLEHELSSRLTGKVGFTAEKYEHAPERTYTRRYLGDASLIYKMAEGMTGTLSYIYVDSYSPGIEGETKRVNRVALELRKVF